MEALGPLRLIDDRLAVSRAPGEERTLIPLARRPDPNQEVPDGQLLEATVPLDPKLPPAQRVRLTLESELPEPVLDRLPTGWQMLGDVCVVRLDEALLGHGETIGQALAEALDARAVLHLDGSQGELREPETRHLWGARDTRTIHREHGLVFHLDPADVMFSAGNKHERHRLVDQIQPAEHVVDLFAGIGYFTLPLARAGAQVTACEKNPTSAAFLAENAEANDLRDRIEIRQGDCRQVAPAGVADRVLLGYFPGTHAFLGCALEALKPEGGQLHYHTTADAQTALEDAEAELVDHLPATTGQPRLLEARRVKGVGPGRVHVVLDMEVVP